MTNDSVNVGDSYIRKLHIYKGSQQMLKRAIENHPEQTEERVSKYFSYIVDECNNDSDLRDVVIAVNSDNTGIMKAEKNNYCQIRDGERVEFDRPTAVKISLVAAGVDLDMQYGTGIAKEYFRGCNDAFKPQFRRFANEQYGEITGHNLIPVYGEINVEKQTGKYTAPKPIGQDVAGKPAPDLELLMDSIISESEANAIERSRQMAMEAALKAAEEKKLMPLNIFKF